METLGKPQLSTQERLEKKANLYEILNLIPLVMAIANRSLSENLDEFRSASRRIIDSRELLMWGFAQKELMNEVDGPLRQLSSLPRAYYEDLVDFALDIIYENFPILERDFTQSFEKKNFVVRRVVNTAELFIEKSANENLKKAGIKLLEIFLDQVKDRFKAGITEVSSAPYVPSPAYSNFFSLILEYGSEEKRKDLNQFLDAMENRQKKTVAISLLESGRETAVSKARVLVRDVLGPLGFNTDKMFDAWRIAGPAADFPWRVADNILAVEGLENYKRGSAAYLEKEFGIINFMRYPPELLKKQYDNRNDVGGPYGVILNPKHDYNGAFSQHPFIWSGLLRGLDGAQHTLGEAYNLRVIEAGTKMEIARKLIELDQKYGSKQKISFAIIGGHGTANSIKFGGEDSKHSLFVKDLARPRIQRAGSFFVGHPTIILNSCSTGAREGLGQKMSETFGAEVIAPDRPTAIKQISAEARDGKLAFYVVYLEEESRKAYTSGKLKSES